MTEGFSMGGGSVQAGTIFVGVKIQDVEKALAQMKGLETQAKTTGQNAAKGMQQMGVSLGDVGKEVTKLIAGLGLMVGSVKVVREVWDSWLAYGKQETAINRIIVAMESMDLATVGMRQELDRLGSTFIANGQREEAAWSSYRRLIQATHDRSKAQEYLNKALNFAIRQDTDVETVAIALAKAYTGQYKSLDMLLSQYGEAGKEAKTFAEALGMVEQLGAGANRILSDEETAINAVKSSWDQLRDTLGKGFSSQAIEGLHLINRFMENLAATARKPGEFYMQGGNIPTPDELQRRLGFDPGGRNRAGGPESEPPSYYRPNWLDWFGGGAKPPSDRKEPGKPPEDYGTINGWTLGEGYKRPERGEAGTFSSENWEKMNAEFKRLLKIRQDAWDDAHKEMFRITDTFTSTVGGLMERMLDGAKVTFEDLGQVFRSMIARMLTDLAMSRLQTWFDNIINAGSFGGGARPGGGGSVTGTGWGGARPIQGGGTTVVLQGTTGGGILAAIYRGSTLQERKQVFKDGLLVGSRAALMTR